MRAFNYKKKPKHITTHRYFITERNHIFITSRDSKSHTMIGHCCEEEYKTIGDFKFKKYDYHTFEIFKRKEMVWWTF